jgi:hypothetical protein
MRGIRKSHFKNLEKFFFVWVRETLLGRCSESVVDSRQTKFSVTGMSNTIPLLYVVIQEGL